MNKLNNVDKIGLLLIQELLNLSSLQHSEIEMYSHCL